MMTNLKAYFPMLPEREALLTRIRNSPELFSVFQTWKKDDQEYFLDFCTGARGIKILYDSFFKEVMNPEYSRERLAAFLSAVLQRNVKIVRILPNDSTRISDETSLLITDIIVELEDGSLANVEVQKIGYAFPGERCACYSSDMLLRQYKRVRSASGDEFAYNQIRNVYLIVLYEKSPKEFKKFPKEYFHYSRQIFDTGLQLNLLQEYIMIPLDIFRLNMDNKSIETPLEAWLTFFSDDRPEKIIELITKYPDFKAMYETLYQMCQNVEKVMGMFSEELRILDRSTVKYMVEEQQQEIDALHAKLEQRDTMIEQQNTQIKQRDAQIKQQNAQIEQLNNIILTLNQRLEVIEQKFKSLQIECPSQIKDKPF